MKQSDLYAVMGNPIQHSLSPSIHLAFAEQTKQSISYEKILVPFAELPKAIAEFIARGGKGLSITLPFKEQAFACMDEVNDFAQQAKAVNNIMITPNKKLIGVNTDGIGLVNDLQKNLNISLKHKRILLLGAGGAVRGVLPALLKEQPQQVSLVNRTIEKAEILATEFSTYGPVTVCRPDQLTTQTFDIVINGTSASITHEMPLALPSMPNLQLCYDMMYSKTPTPFLQWAKQQDAACIADGIGMLIEQAAEIFFLWRGVRPQTQGLIATYRV